MGGTFDPIHVGHLILGEKTYEQLGLDKIWFMPAGNPPHKRNRAGRATDEQRVAMVERAISGNPHFELSLIEMHDHGLSYTYHTLENLRKQNPDTDYYFIIGADSLYSFTTWMKPERICAACTIVVATRDHTPVKELSEEMERLTQLYHGHFVRLDTMNIDISSQLLRQWHQEGKSLRYYVYRTQLPTISTSTIFMTLRKERPKRMADYDFIKMQKNFPNISMKIVLSIRSVSCSPAPRWQWSTDMTSKMPKGRAAP